MNLATNVVDHFDGAKGADVTIDSSKGTSGADIKSGKVDIDHLHVKSGKGTGMEDMHNLNGIASDNVKKIADDMKDGSKATAAEKKKDHDDIWKLNDEKIKAAINSLDRMIT